MAHVTLYNYSDSHHEVTIPLAKGITAEIEQITAGTVRDSFGNDWTINKEASDAHTYLALQCMTGYSTSQMVTALSSIGITVSGVGSADIISAYSGYTSFTYDFGGSSTGTNYPIYKIGKESHENDDTYFLRLYRNAGLSNGTSVIYADGDDKLLAPMGFDIGIPSIGNICYGLIALQNYGSHCGVIIYMDEHVNGSTLAPYDLDPGEKGFRPTGDHTKNNAGGGNKSGQGVGYETDELEQPGEPDETKASVAGTGFVNVYDVTSANLANFGKCLYSSTILTGLANLFINPMDGVVSLNIFPYVPHVGSSTAIKLINWSCTTMDLGVNASGFPLTKQFRTVDFGTLSIAEMWESFLDYDASSFALYLPFIGTVDIPVGEVMNGSVNVQYTIDFFTGGCVANVLCTKTATLSSGQSVTQFSQHSYQGNCAIQVPLTAVSYGNLVGSMINAVASGMKSGLAGAGMSLASDLASGGFKPTVETKGAITANGGFCAVTYPYITVTRPVTAEPESYQEVIGYPSYIDTKLATCQGLCVCDNINLSGLSGATESEINRIKQICKEGLYI